MKYEFIVSGSDYSQAGNASTEIKKILQRIGVPSAVIKRAAVVMYEAEMNMIVHAGGGKAFVEIRPEEIVIEMKDEGPGIPNIEQAMQDGWSSATDEIRYLGFGAGMGLPNMKRNSDEFTIETTPGKGTKVKMVIHVEK